MLETLFQQLLNGLTLGGIYALIALGYTMVYGIVKLINFAHGDIFMVGAFIGLLVATTFIDNFLIAIAISMLFCAAVGFLVEKTAYRPLRGSNKPDMIFTAVMVSIILLIAYLARNPFLKLFTSPMFWVMAGLLVLLIVLILSGRVKGNTGGSSRINALISAIGMSIIITSVVTRIHGAQRSTYPQMLDLGFIKVKGVSIDGLQIFIIISSFLLMYGLYYVVHKTKVGVAMRAVSQNMHAAKLMGINPNRIISFTFAIGSSLAGAAGVLVGIFGKIAEPVMGSMYGMKAFVAAVLGGIGSIPGAMVGGLILGVAEVLSIAYIAPSFKDAIAFGALILILLIKPTGIFGSKIREKV